MNATDMPLASETPMPEVKPPKKEHSYSKADALELLVIIAAVDAMIAGHNKEKLCKAAEKLAAYILSD